MKNDWAQVNVLFHRRASEALLVLYREFRQSVAGFAIMVVTGLLLFYSAPLRYYHNLFFRVKVLLLVVAGINVWLFHGRIHRAVAGWDLDAVPPRAARIAGAISLLVWAAIVVSGRLIAYNWFDCEIQPQPPFVNWASGCIQSGD